MYLLVQLIAHIEIVTSSKFTNSSVLFFVLIVNLRKQKMLKMEYVILKSLKRSLSSSCMDKC